MAKKPSTYPPARIDHAVVPRDEAHPTGCPFALLDTVIHVRARHHFKGIPQGSPRGQDQKRLKTLSDRAAVSPSPAAHRQRELPLDSILPLRAQRPRAEPDSSWPAPPPTPAAPSGNPPEHDDSELQFTLADVLKLPPISDHGKVNEIIGKGGADQLRTSGDQV